MKILLVSPNSPNSFWSFKHALEFLSKKAVLPPLGLLTVAAMLPDDWELKLVDMAVTELNDLDIQWADYVFISAMYVQKGFVRQIIDRCKRMKKKTVAGGPLFTLVPDEYNDVDHLVINEAELTLPQFLKDLARGSAKHLYTSDQWANVQDTPLPAWNLIDQKQYASMCLQYSRGCPFDCDFCDVTTRFGHKSRTKSKAQILAELESIYNLGWKGPVFFVDDNLIGNKQHLKKEILPGVIEWLKEKKYPFSFNTQVSINLADDDELMRLMTQAGFNCVFVGIETPNEESLAECNKVQNKGRDLIACVKKIQQAGMEVQGGFILGFDHDNHAVFETLIRFIQESGIATAMVGLLNAPQGTKLYERMVREKRLLHDSTGDNTDLTMNFVPVMVYKELLQGYRHVVQTIYSEKNYYNRVLAFLKNYNRVTRNRGRTEHCDIKAFVKSLWRLGVVAKGRKYYWRAILWALMRPRYFNTAVRLTIFGHHFRTMFEELYMSAKDRRAQMR